MVHALHEAHRVLVPNGLLIDLRPALVHRRIGISQEGRWKQVGVMEEPFDDDRAANRAVTQIVAEGLFQRVSRTQIDCWRVMDTLAEFRAFLSEWTSTCGSRQVNRLYEQVEHALKGSGGKSKIVLRGPLMLQVLMKEE